MVVYKLNGPSYFKENSILFRFRILVIENWWLHRIAQSTTAERHLCKTNSTVNTRPMGFERDAGRPFVFKTSFNRKSWFIFKTRLSMFDRVGRHSFGTFKSVQGRPHEEGNMDIGFPSSIYNLHVLRIVSSNMVNSEKVESQLEYCIITVNTG